VRAIINGKKLMGRADRALVLNAGVRIFTGHRKNVVKAGRREAERECGVEGGRNENLYSNGDN
jgi:hypothetical protein